MGSSPEAPFGPKAQAEVAGLKGEISKRAAARAPARRVAVVDRSMSNCSKLHKPSVPLVPPVPPDVVSGRTIGKSLISLKKGKTS